MKTLIILLLVSATSVQTLKCYSCIYSTLVKSNQECKGPAVASKYLMTCPVNSTKCTKVTTKTSSGTSSETVARACSPSATTGGCVDILNNKVCTFSCSTDACNVGSSLLASKTEITAAVIATLTTLLQFIF